MLENDARLETASTAGITGEMLLPGASYRESGGQV